MTNQAIRKEKAGADVTLTIRIQMLTILAAAAGEAIRYRNRFPSLLDSRVALVYIMMRERQDGLSFFRELHFYHSGSAASRVVRYCCDDVISFRRTLVDHNFVLLVSFSIGS